MHGLRDQRKCGGEDLGSWVGLGCWRGFSCLQLEGNHLSLGTFCLQSRGGWDESEPAVDYTITYGTIQNQGRVAFIRRAASWQLAGLLPCSSAVSALRENLGQLGLQPSELHLGASLWFLFVILGSYKDSLNVVMSRGKIQREWDLICLVGRDPQHQRTGTVESEG